MKPIISKIKLKLSVIFHIKFDFNGTISMLGNLILAFYVIFPSFFFTGYFKAESMVQTMAKLRTIKVNSNDQRITPMTELAYIPRKTNGQYPGLFIFTGASRYVFT